MRAMPVARTVLAVAGLALLGWGGYGWLTADGAEPVGQAFFLAAVLAAHDFVVVPVVLALGALSARLVPPVARRPVRAALVLSGAVSAVAFAFVVGAGRIADNPSAFPQHYGRNLALILALIWLAAAVWAAVLARRGRRRP